ncbi:unnamed protein product [Cyprideis torosa]|uniref:Uncharacterized protein n=1 Tax=Cyprideis torosa TaxID=163714 RepID=A0A7R8WAD5_9CRUS|nr:unnamed protein product [Cyprideis torosa]CAG0890825.1 unnamed protein product [Cyprideis torosa]
MIYELVGEDIAAKRTEMEWEEGKRSFEREETILLFFLYSAQMRVVNRASVHSSVIDWGEFLSFYKEGGSFPGRVISHGFDVMTPDEAMNDTITVDYLLESLFDFLPLEAAVGAYQWIYISLLGIWMYSFWLFSPLAYGYTGNSSNPNSTVHGLKWIESWEF